MLETRYGDCSVNNEEDDVQQFLNNDLFFRSTTTVEQYNKIKRIGIDDIAEKHNYLYISNQYPAVIFIDLKDINQYIEVNKDSGIEEDDLRTLTELILDHYGEQSTIHEIIWNDFADKIATIISAKLGLEYNDVLLGDLFNRYMKNLFDIGGIILGYLINANIPIIEEISLYKLGKINKGLLGLQQRSFEEIHEFYSH